MLTALLVLLTLSAHPATTTTSQPATAIPFWHMIVTADDDGVMVRGLVELHNGPDSSPVELTFPNAVDLQAGVSPESVPIQFDGSLVKISPPPNAHARLEFQYWLPWPDGEETAKPLTIGLAQNRPITTAMVSLPLQCVRFETRGLNKEQFETHEVYMGHDLGVQSDAAVLIYPPKPWWGRALTRFVLIASLGLMLIFIILKKWTRNHA
jgi:hypothetical protein